MPSLPKISTTAPTANSVGREAAHWLCAIAIPAVMATSALGAPAATSAEAGRIVYEKANCIGCHKWHGGGGGGYGGAALSLRATELTREQIIEVVNCGRPATGMPFHVRGAYTATPCYDLMKADLGEDMPPPGIKMLRPEEVEAVVTYLESAIKGKGEPTKDDCVAFWGAASRQCGSMK